MANVSSSLYHGDNQKSITTLPKARLVTTTTRIPKISKSAEKSRMALSRRHPATVDEDPRQLANNRPQELSRCSLGSAQKKVQPTTIFASGLKRRKRDAGRRPWIFERRYADGDKFRGSACASRTRSVITIVGESKR